MKNNTIKMEIKNIAGDVIYCSPTAKTIKQAVEEAVDKCITLSRASLEWAILCKANLEGADLSGANLKGASLCKANLEGADLSGANLRYSNLSGANFEGANHWGLKPFESNP